MVKELEGCLAQKYVEPIDIYAWSRIEVVQGSKGPIPLMELTRTFNKRQIKYLPEEVPMVLEASAR